MAMNATSLSAAVKTLYEHRLLTRALPRLLYGKFGSVARLTGFGSYELRRYNSLSAVTTSLSEGVTPTENAAPTITTVTLTPLWYGAWVSYTDQLQLEAYDPVISETSDILGEQTGLSIDTILRTTVTDGSTKLYSGSSTSRATISATDDKISYSDVVAAIATLETQNARPVEGDMFAAYLHPNTWATLMQDSVFVAMWTKYTPSGDSPIRTGFMGSILRCNLYVGSNVRTYSGAGASSCTPASMTFIGEGAYGMAGVASLVVDYTPGETSQEYENNSTEAIRPIEIIVKDLGETGLDPLNQRGTIAWKATHAASVLQTLWMVDLEHATIFS